MNTIRLRFTRVDQGRFLVELFLDSANVHEEGYLPALPPKLTQALENWRASYRRLMGADSSLTNSAVLEQVDDEIIGGGVSNVSGHYNLLNRELSQWLRADTFSPIRERLSNLQPSFSGEVLIILDFESDTLEAERIILKRLPWRNWSYLTTYYSRAEVALSARRSQLDQGVYHYPHRSKIRILLVLGEDIGITRDHLTGLFSLPINSPNTVDEITVLSAENLTVHSLGNALRDKHGYHIFICIAHSETSHDGATTHIKLNADESIDINQFNQTLNSAVERGLKLIILDCCDNLGAWNRFTSAGLPQFILIKELIKESAAVAFLNEFFNRFSGGDSLPESVYRARATLEDSALKYPGVFDLPTICIRPGVEPLTWRSLVENLQPPEPEPLPPKPDPPPPDPDPLPRQSIWGRLTAFWNGLPRLLKKVLPLFAVGLVLAAILRFVWPSESGPSSPSLPPAASPLEQLRRQEQQKSPRSPQAIIDLNNEIVQGKTAGDGSNLFKIAVIAPQGGDGPDSETFRGVAQAQTEFNCSTVEPFNTAITSKDDVDLSEQCRGSNGKFLRIEHSDYPQANPKALTQKLIADQSIQAVVGRYPSSDLQKISDLFSEQNGLVLVTTTSNATRESLSLTSDYIYRVIPDVKSTVTQLKESQYKMKKINVIYAFGSEKTSYSGSLAFVMNNDPVLKDVTLLQNSECNLGGPEFQVNRCLEKVNGQVLILVPNLDGGQLKNAFDVIREVEKARPRNLETILGSDTLYNPTLVTDLSSDQGNGLGAIAAKLEVRIMVPWARSLGDRTPFERGALTLWRGGLINWRTAMAYDATKVVLQGLLVNPTRAELKDTLLNRVFGGDNDTATGKIQFDPETKDRISVKPLRVFVKVVKDNSGRYNFVREN